MKKRKLCLVVPDEFRRFLKIEALKAGETASTFVIAAVVQRASAIRERQKEEEGFNE